MVPVRLTFLGTAASEGYPDAFCDCDNCEAARSLGGPSLRKRSAALVNDDLLLDLGPDVLAAAMVHDVPLTRVRYCLLTHEHSDHLDPTHFSSRRDACGPNGRACLDFYATEGALRVAAARLGNHMPARGLRDPRVGERLHLAAHAIDPFVTLTVGPYRVASVLANHGSGTMVPLAYVVEQDERRLFYCTDTGPLPEDTWRALRTLGQPIHVVALDHTFGLKAAEPGHLNLEQFVGQIERLRAERILADDARVFAHHIGHHSNPPHPLLVEVAARRGYEVAYDGLSLNV
jgi:phosphoribosyl 1,2-cyclic phosphate phosphodiesterase